MLHGALQEFSLPDVFHLLSLTGKSGTLRLDAAGEQGEVRFRSGAVTFATADVRRMPLAGRLVAEGLLGEEQLEEVLAAHRSGGVSGLLHALREGGVEESILTAALRAQIQDAVSTLMRREQGTFAFTPGAPDDEAVAIDTGELVEEGRRRIEQWAAMCDSLPSMDAVLALRPTLPSDLGALEVTAAEWQHLVFVDGVRRVRDIVELAAKGEHASCQVLDGLVRKGLVEAVDVDAGETGALGQLLARRAALQRLEASAASDDAGATDAVAVEEPGTPPSDDVSAHEQAEPEASADDHEDPADDRGGPAPDPEQHDAQADDPTARVRALAQGVPLAAVSAAPTSPAVVPTSLATHGVDPSADAAPAAIDEPEATAAPAGPHRPLTRDEDVNKGLLLRLIDGVKGA